MAKKKLEKLKKEKKAINMARKDINLKIVAESSKSSSKKVEKDAHVQFITARPKTFINQRERHN